MVLNCFNEIFKISISYEKKKRRILMIYDVIIIGGGPAGLTASLYAGRAGLSNIILEKMYVGGQVSTTYEVDNYPGFIEISGSELAMKMDEHAKRHGSKTITDDVTEIDIDNKIFKVKSQNNIYESKTIIITTGAKPKKLEIKNEIELSGKGVSYCATCDGAFFRNKDVAVIGSGNTAVEDAIFLSRFCSKIYLIVRGDKLKAEKSLIDNLKNHKNIEIIYNHITKEILGDTIVEGLVIEDNKNNELKTLPLKGIFVAVGVVPNSNILEGKVKTNNLGYIITDAFMMTSINGIFAAGDARDTPLRQVVTAASDGAIAAYAASVFIAKNE